MHAPLRPPHRAPTACCACCAHPRLHRPRSLRRHCTATRRCGRREGQGSSVIRRGAKPWTRTGPAASTSMVTNDSSDPLPPPLWWPDRLSLPRSSLSFWPPIGRAIRTAFFTLHAQSTASLVGAGGGGDSAWCKQSASAWSSGLLGARTGHKFLGRASLECIMASYRSTFSHSAALLSGSQSARLCIPVSNPSPRKVTAALETRLGAARSIEISADDCTESLVFTWVVHQTVNSCLNSGHSNRILRQFWRNFKFMM
jgi:hypothetical protein